MNANMTPGSPGASSGPVRWQDTSQTRLATAQLTLAAHRLEETGLTSVSSVTGDPGLGKTAVVERIVAQQYTDTGRLALRLSLQSQPKPNELATRLLRQLGHRTDAVGYLLRENLIDALRDRRSVIVIDEAHHMEIAALRNTKILIDELPRTDWILIGTTQLTTQLAKVPELADRVATPTRITALSRAEVLRVMPAAHPLLHDASLDLIVRVNDEFAHGRWRPWRNFIAAATQLAARQGSATLTDALARAAVAHCGGRQATPTTRRRS